MNNIVKTISGAEVDRKMCVKIGEDFYQKNVDCVDIDGRWFRRSNPKIYFNAELNKYMKVTANTVSGICGYDSETGSYIFGKFESVFELTYQIFTARGNYYCSSKKVFDSIPKVWSKNDCVYYDYRYACSIGYNKLSDRINSRYIYDFDRSYNSSKLIPIFSSVDNSKYTEDLLNEECAKSFELIDKYSFGIEFETSNGTIPIHKCKQLGLIPLRDGSIGGHEYTTIPMKGNAGINLLMNQAKTLQEYCSIDKECSTHIHFGGYELDGKKILNLYNLLYYIQDDLGKLFHPYIFNTSNYKASGKDYCKKLPESFGSIDNLYSFLSSGYAEYNDDLFVPHPKDPAGEQKWNNDKRYYFANLINMMFGKGPKTVEFRVHNPTLNASKLINWIFICVAILEYAGQDDITPTKISSATIDSIVSEVYAGDVTTKNTILNYMSKRREFFKNCEILYSDRYGWTDILEDNIQQFKTPYDL